MSKLFVTDEGRWVTINGRHVYIGESGLQFSKPSSNMKGKLSNIDKEYDKADSKYENEVHKLDRDVKRAEKKRNNEVDKLNQEARNLASEHSKRSRNLRKTERRLKGLGAEKYNSLIKRLQNKADAEYEDYDKKRDNISSRKLDAENAMWGTVNRRNEEKNKHFDTMLKEHRQARKKEKAIKNVLSKAREKINAARETDRFNKAMNLGKYRKPYYETDAFKSGFERHLKGLDEV